MKKRFYSYLGAFFIIVGIILLLSYFSITGFIISENTSKEAIPLSGFVLLIIGIIFLMAGRGKVGVLESEAGVVLNVTKPFEKAIKRYDIERIDNALRKIGTGLGDEESLRGELKGSFSIHAGKGERVIFTYGNHHKEATLINYLPDHEYKKLLRK